MSEQVVVPALEIADLLAAADFAVKIRIERATGLNYKRLRLLRDISLYPELNVGEHAKRLGMEPTHASYHLRALAMADCIETHANGQASKLNTRLVFYRITSTGESYLSEMRKKATRAAREAMAGTELHSLRQALDRHAFAE